VAKDREGDIRSSLSLIYLHVHEMIRFGMTEFLNEELANTRLDGLSSDVLLGLLTATLPARSKLPFRQTLFNITKRLLKSRGHYEHGILDGLE
jgi:hypothetical protein